jgi:hypothetical protein
VTRGDTEPADDYTFLYGNGNSDRHLGTGFLIHKGIILAVRKIEFVSDAIPYLILKGRWCDIVVLNVHA